MKKLNILVIATKSELLEVLLRLVNKQENWQGQGAESVETAKELFAKDNFDIVLLGVGIDNEPEVEAYFKSQKPKVITIQHYGGGSGLLYNEIQSALDAQKSSN